MYIPYVCLCQRTISWSQFSLFTLLRWLRWALFCLPRPAGLKYSQGFPFRLGSTKTCTVCLRFPSVLKVTIREVRAWLGLLHICSPMPNTKQDFDSMYWMHKTGTDGWEVRREYGENKATTAWRGPSKDTSPWSKPQNTSCRGDSSVSESHLWSPCFVSALHRILFKYLYVLT